jgi:putative salt-induced outer membrane protein YdiY
MVRERRARSRSLFLITACVLAPILPTAAQVNIEALRRDTAGPGFSGTLGAELAVQTGNTELVNLGIRGRTDYRGGRLTTFLVGEATLGLLKGRQFTSTGLAHFRQAYALQPRLEPEWYAQVNYDKPRLIDRRALLGAGFRFRIGQRQGIRLWTGTGLMLEHEQLGLPSSATHPAETTVIRSSNYLSLRLTGGETFLLTSTTYLQPMIAEPGDVRILENLALVVGITSGVGLTVRFDLRYDSRPPDTIRSLDTSLLTGVTLGF